MSRKFIHRALPLAALLVAGLLAALPQAALAGPPQPLINGHIADPQYGSTAVFWEPVVSSERIFLTLSTPCGPVVKEFEGGKGISFDIAELEPDNPDGNYSWELRVVPVVDPEIREVLDDARNTGDMTKVDDLRRQGLLPQGPFVESGRFSVVEGRVVVPTTEGEEEARLMAPAPDGAAGTLESVTAPLTEVTGLTVLTNSDGIIRNSLCVGFDCPDNPTFDDTTILMMENNTRIKFSDTSTASGFPTNDWEIEANDRFSGGLSYLAFNDCGTSSGQGGCVTDLVFGVEAGVRQHALWVESSGEVGIGTQNPVLELHAVAGDTPGLRLDQDGSSGFQPQRWDLAGNETSFFVRDATNGSTLPFRIRPTSPSNALVIDTDGDIGVGILTAGSGSSNDPAVHVFRSSGATSRSGVLVQYTQTGGRTLLELENNGDVNYRLTNASSGSSWQTLNQGDNYNVSLAGSGATEFSLNGSGNLTITGTLTTGGPSCGGGCDAVFSPDYDLPSIEEHAALMWEKRHLPAIGPTVPNAPINLSEATGNILNELEKAHIYIEQLHRRLAAKEGEVEQLQEEFEQLRSLVSAFAGQD